MVEKKELAEIKLNMPGLREAQSLLQSVAETNKALGRLVLQNTMRHMFDASALRQISRIQGDTQRLFEQVKPTLGIVEKFLGQQGPILESINTTLQLESIYQAQLNALASITKINFPVFNLPNLIRERQEYIHQRLETELKNLNEEYFKMWAGSWAAVDSDNPDKVRQSANSMRELFRTLLHDYSDNNQIMKEHSLKKKGDITRRHRLAFILRDSEAESEDIAQLDGTIAFALEVDDEMQKAAHSGGEEEKFRNMLYVYEGFVWMILEQKLVA